MPLTETHEARLRLSLAPGVGPILMRRLEQELGGVAAVCSASAEKLSRVEGIGLKKADMIRRGIDEADVERELGFVEQFGARLVAIDDQEYPSLLRHIPDPPPLLYLRGELDRADAVALAIVGARQCTVYGREQADRLAGLCAQAGLTIVSGGARGIDTAAHRAALRVGGRTIAVLGCGLAHCYPPENGPLFDEVTADRGAVISEMPMQAPPIAENFPRRNRIISGLSLGVLVVEASARSGALITARLATEEHHREVMALPGRVDSSASSGCHKIIREGWVPARFSIAWVRRGRL
jgi:DNA processing protein